MVAKGFYNLDASTWYALRFIAATAPGKLFAFTVSDTVLSELRRLAAAWYEEYNDHRFRSAEMLAEVETE